MYRLKVLVPEGGIGDGPGDKRKGIEVVDTGGAETSGQSYDERTHVRFSSGNPRVSAIKGVVHLYRDTSDATESFLSLPHGRSPHVCVLAVPMHKSVGDFCQFMGSFISTVQEMHIFRDDGCAERYMVLMKFNSQALADEFHAEYNGKAFSSMEPELCHVVFVADVEYTDSGQSACTPPSGLTELPSCPVCLERLDQHISGILTTVCNHSFHSTCISKWADSSCPVCRYCQQQPEKSTCTICGATENLWICLICGFVGCGRYQEGHAINHWRETQHCYSLETESHRVWDYVGDGYVHRLIQSKTDGKLVELPSPCDRAGECSCSCGGPDTEMAQAVVNSKIDMVEMEYSRLIAHQLDSQRKHFEDLLLEAETQKVLAIAAAEERGINVRIQRQAAKIAELEKNNAFLKEVNESLVDNQRQWQQKVKEQEDRESKAILEKDLKIADLQEQVRDLMFYLEARKTVEQVENSEDIREGTVLPLPKPEIVTGVSSSKGPRRSRKKS